jgi:hypothetical protein
MAALAPSPAGRENGKLVESGGEWDTLLAGDQEEQPLFSYRNLLQELLAALLGYTGDVFVDAADADAGAGAPRPSPLQHPSVCTVRLAGGLGWVEARDRQLLDRLANLAFHFKQLRAFVEAERAASPRSAHRQALCAGITGAAGVRRGAAGQSRARRGGAHSPGMRTRMAPCSACRQQTEAAPPAPLPPPAQQPSAQPPTRAAPRPMRPMRPLPPPSLPPLPPPSCVLQSSWACTKMPSSSCSACCWSSRRRAWPRCSTSCCRCRCARGRRRWRWRAQLPRRRGLLKTAACCRNGYACRLCGKPNALPVALHDHNTHSNSCRSCISSHGSCAAQQAPQQQPPQQATRQIRSSLARHPRRRRRCAAPRCCARCSGTRSTGSGRYRRCSSGCSGTATRSCSSSLRHGMGPRSIWGQNPGGGR